MHVNKSCTVMTRALVNFSPWLRISSWLELRGKQMVSYVCSSGEGGTGGKDLPVCTCTCNDVVLKSYPNLASH